MDLTPNDTTILAYNKDYCNYITNTPDDYQAYNLTLFRWLDTCVDLVSNEGVIFEIGSGQGRDARYFQSKGRRIICSDAAHVFVDYLKTKGFNTLSFNPLRDDFTDKYEMIFANAVIPHFTKNDLDISLKKIYAALKPDGLLALSAKQGKGEEWVEEKSITKRYIQYWGVLEIRDYLKERGFEVFYQDTNIPGHIESHIWTQIIAKKC